MTQPGDLPVEELLARLRSQGYRVVHDGPRHFRESRFVELAQGRRRVRLMKELGWLSEVRLGFQWFDPRAISAAVRGDDDPFRDDWLAYREEPPDEAEGVSAAADVARRTEEALRHVPLRLLSQLGLAARASKIVRRRDARYTEWIQRA